MLVKAKEGQISFLFQEQDPFFEIGFRILEQEQISQMLPCQRRRQNGREKLVFQANGENLALLMDIVPKLGEDELLSLLCGMISLNIKVEENGFLKKECIWYQYEHLYYDRVSGCLMAAILPISGELRYADGGAWYDCFEASVTRIAASLPYSNAVRQKTCADVKDGKNVTGGSFGGVAAHRRYCIRRESIRSWKWAGQDVKTSLSGKGQGA